MSQAESEREELNILDRDTVPKLERHLSSEHFIRK